MRSKALLVLAIALPIASCGPVDKDATGAASSRYPSGLDAKESPMLAALVAQGKLPPLSQRLPEEPLVVKPVERPGLYGGTWHIIHENPDLGSLKMIAAYAPLLRWKADNNGIEPGLAKSYEYTDGGRTLTLHLRKGLKWSDGFPFTSADFKYWYDLCTDKGHRIKLSPPGWCIVNGKPMTVEAPDPLTIVMRFAGPNFFAHLQLAMGFWASEESNIPKHYMREFDPDYNHKYRDFVLFEKKNITHTNPDRPTMCPWRLKSIEAAGYRVTLERNPYYYMVDTLGRQLPYIDRIQSSLVTDPQIRMLRIMSGEVDAQWRMLDLTDISLYLRGQKRGNYRIKLWQEGWGSMSTVLVNWDVADPVLSKLFRDQRFRRALSYAIPREKINAAVFKGMAEPQNSVISAESWHFASPEGHALYEQWRHLYCRFDLKKANALLDEIGLKRGPDGMRLRPDGRPLRLIYTTNSAAAIRLENDETVMIADEWKKLGVDVIISTPPGPEVSNRITLGNYEIAMFGQSEVDLFTYPDWVFPTGSRYWHPLTGKWYETGGKQGHKPEGPMKDLLAIFDRIKAEPDLEKCHRLVWEAVRIHINEGPFCLGIVGRAPSLVLVKNYFHNVPAVGGALGPWAATQPAASYPEQFYMDSAGTR